MRKIFLILAASSLLTGCETSNLATFAHSGQAADLATTVYFLEFGTGNEGNPIADDFSTAQIVAYKLAGNVILHYLGEHVPSARRSIQAIQGVLGWGAAGWNLQSQ